MRRYYIYVFIFIVLIVFLGIKILSLYNSSLLVFLSYNGFEINGDTIVGCNIKGGNIVIPRMVDGVEITKIGDNAFNGLEINNIYIPNSIISIGDYAFANNNIKSLKIPSSVREIGEGAFIHNNISNLEMSSDIILGDACFNDNDLDINSSFFYRDEELISYGGKIKGNILIPKVEIIGNKAFYETNIVSVSISNTVTTIKEYAFKNNYLVEVYLPNNIDFVAETAFSNNNYLTTIVVDKNISELLNYPWGAYNSDLYWLK